MIHAPSDLFTSAGLREALGSRPFEFEAQTGSTNDIARAWAASGGPTGAVVLTEEQLSGRGRFGRMWLSPAGTSLLMSVILHPKATNGLRLTMIGAVAVAETLSTYITDPDVVSLKWPNDVLLSGRKVAGVLAEALWQGESLQAVIVGIGLNVRINFANTPLADRAISLETVMGEPVNRLSLLKMLLERIDYWSMRVDNPALLATWSGLLDTLGKPITVSTLEDESPDLHGTAVGVDEHGALLLQTSDGTLHTITAGEVTVL